MEEDLACYFNGNYIKQHEVKISLRESCLWRGTAVYDMARTYNHVPFFWEKNIGRLYRSLSYVRIDPGLTPEEMLSISYEVLERNKKKLKPGDDVVMAQLVSSGEYTSSYFFGAPTHPTVLVMCYPLSPRYKAFAKNYREGIHLSISNTRHIPPQCIDPRLKHTSRWCNHLADFDVKMFDPEAWALMLDINGLVAEGPTFSCFVVKDSKLFTPKLGSVLEGITRGTILGLAKDLGIETTEKELYVYDLYNADEIFVTASSYAICPVATFNTRVLRKPIPGPITKQLLSAFSKLAGVDIVERVQHVISYP